MRNARLRTIAVLAGLFCAAGAYSQQFQPIAAVPETGALPKTGAVPNIIRFGGSFHPANGMPAQPVESVTFSVYRDPIGGNPLWQETQNVALNGEGQYSVLMGATQNEGVPIALLSAAEPRWLGAQFNRPGEAEQPRVLLASVPYALKASDAETLGGLPASAYLLAPAAGANLAGGAVSSTAPSPTVATAVKPRATTGTAGFIGVFTDPTDLGNSVMYQLNGTIGLGTVPGMNASTVPSLDLRTSPFSQIGMAQTVDYLTFFASDSNGPAIYWNPGKDMRFGKGGSGLYDAYGFAEQMRIQSSTGNVGIGTNTPGSKLDVKGDINFSGSVLYQESTILQVPGGVSDGNIALGLHAVPSSTTGFSNTAVGYRALSVNAGGSYNTATGLGALASNGSGSFNTATGLGALASNGGGSGNTAFGSYALGSSTASGTSGNTAVGYQALQGGPVTSNNTGTFNTATGYQALAANTSGSYNTASGTFALQNNTSGSNNIAIGLGAATNVSGGNSNNIDIGSVGSALDGGPGGGAIRIGTTGTHTSFFAAGVRGVTPLNNDGIPVYVDSAGQLGTASSSRRFKEDIEDMGAASADLMRLRPVTFRYKRPFADGSKPIQYGLIAEEVDEVYPDLVAHSADGQIESVKYQVLDSMLLNEVQRQHAEIRRLEERLAKLEAALTKASSVQ